MASDNHLGVDLSEYSHADVAERIREYIGAYEAKQVDIDAITNVVVELFKLKGSRDREVFLSAVGAFFCRHCGSGYLPCYCVRDD